MRRGKEKELALTASRLRELLDYDASTGIFRWKVRSSNRIKIGDVAGAQNPVTKYLSISVGGVLYRAHRLAWLYTTGEWPSGEIDHINGDRTDNRFANLRDVSTVINMQNVRKARSDNQSGVIGAHWSKQKRKWRSSIKVPGEGYKYLGYFDTAEDAHNAYMKAKRRYHEGCTI